eukprot:GDKJ01007137.1.p1 GENE.GDKJ01007137.1~~GDKJ01007137.1.p1  ORF type:complete len:196 (-),score=12.99 GDKJ01007137.1:59-646(-)
MGMLMNNKRLVNLTKRFVSLAWESPHKENTNMNFEYVGYSRVALFIMGCLTVSHTISAFSDPVGYFSIIKRRFDSSSEPINENLISTVALSTRQTAALFLVFSVVCFRALRGTLEEIVGGLAICLTYLLLNILNFGANYIATGDSNALNETIEHLLISGILGFLFWKVNVHSIFNPTSGKAPEIVEPPAKKIKKN